MKKLIAEAIGTFVLVFAGTGAVVVDASSGHAVTHVGIGLTWGIAVMAMIYAVGDVSGAHLNPAVTIGFWTAGRFPGRAVAPYVVGQLFGAFAASLLLRFLFPQSLTLGETLPAGPIHQSFVLEIILSAILMFVILSVATGPKETGILAGIAIGGVIGMEALFAGPVCGASMNPARSLAPAIVSGHLSHLWIYLAAPPLGTIMAVPAWLATRSTRSVEKR